MNAPLTEGDRRQFLWMLARHIKERMSAQSSGLRRYTPQVNIVRRGTVPYAGR